MDTLFKGLDGAGLRYEHGGLLYWTDEETHEKKRPFLVSLKSNKLYVGHQEFETINKDSFPLVIDKCSSAKEIITMFESYGIYEMLIRREERKFYMTFVSDGQNQTAHVAYRTFDEECIYKRDSIIKRGWNLHY